MMINKEICKFLIGADYEDIALDTSTARDLSAHVRANGLDTLNLQSYVKLVSAQPDLFPYIYYSTLMIHPTHTFEEILKQIESFYNAVQKADDSGVALVPINDLQKNTWDIIGTFIDLSTTTNVQGILPHDKTAVTADIIKYGNSESMWRMADLKVDIEKHPEMFNVNTLGTLSPIKFIGEDNGKAWMAVATSGHIKTFCQIMDKVFERAHNMGSLMLLTDRGFDSPPDDQAFLSYIGTMKRDFPVERIQEFIDKIITYIKRYETFVNSLPAKGEGIEARWVEKLPMYKPEDIHDYLADIAFMQIKLFKGLEQLPASLGLMKLMLLKAHPNLDFSAMPDSWVIKPD